MRLSHLTGGNSAPNGKPRVPVNCHPEEYCALLQQTADVIFATQNCAVLFPEDRSIPAFSEKANIQCLSQKTERIYPQTAKIGNARHSRAISV